MKQADKMTGGCACGNVRYEAEIEARMLLLNELIDELEADIESP